MLTVPPVEVASLCYREGWRDKNLITMVAIVGATSGYDVEFTDGERYGLFGLKPISMSTDVDNFYNPAKAATIARALYEDKYFTPWICWATGWHHKYIKQAIDGVGQHFFKMFEKELEG